MFNRVDFVPLDSKCPVLLLLVPSLRSYVTRNLQTVSSEQASRNSCRGARKAAAAAKEAEEEEVSIQESARRLTSWSQSAPRGVSRP